MSVTRVTQALQQVLQGAYSMCELRVHEDDQASDFWYFIMVKKGLQYPGLYLNIHGRISGQFLLDPALKSLDVQALFTLDNRGGAGDVTCHFVGHGKLHLPGIANSSGMKYGIIDLELSVKQFVGRLPTGQCPVMNIPAGFTIDESVLANSLGVECDCGGRKCGYRDDELHGHAQWCKLVKRSQGVSHG